MLPFLLKREKRYDNGLKNGPGAPLWASVSLSAEQGESKHLLYEVVVGLYKTLCSWHIFRALSVFVIWRNEETDLRKIFGLV